MKKQTFKHSLEKKIARDEVFKRFKHSKIIGLAGPDVIDYVKFLIERGFTDIKIWENDRSTFLSQMYYSTTHQISVCGCFGDILEAPVEKKTLYDLDFCGNLSTMKPHIIKFKDCDVIFTVCLRDGRGRTMDDSLDLFLAYRGELRKSISWSNSKGILIANTGKQFGLYKYLSGKLVMLMIYSY